MDLLQTSEMPPINSQSLERFQERFEALMDNVASVVVTSPQNIKLALLGLFAQGHVLLEDLPGVGKTLMAKTIANSIDGTFITFANVCPSLRFKARWGFAPV